jgi:hypothetical protein
VNQGFKGTRVEVANITITSKASVGTTVKYTVMFTDEEGAVHGWRNNELTIDPDDASLVNPLKALRAALIHHAETAHFNAPASTSAKEELKRGIAEALSGKTDQPQDPGESG